MKHTFRKMFFVFLAVLICVSAFPFSVFGAWDVLEYSWEDEDDGSNPGSATATDFVDGWNDIMRKCNDGNRVTVKFLAGWTARGGDFNTDSTNGPGFLYDTIYVNDNADLIIDLNGRSIDRCLDSSGKWNGEVIYVDEGANLTIKNGTIEGGFSFSGGGGIHVNGGNVTLENVTIKDCDVEEDDGAAIHMDGGKLFVNNCRFESNDFVSDDCFGTIYALDADEIEIKNSTFVPSRYGKAEYGGVIYIDECDKVTIENCVFANFSALKDGGAIWAQDVGKLTISGCTFENCSAGGKGGALYVLGSKLILKNSVFKGNFATSNGGAACIEDSQVKVTDTVFENNKSGNHGGAICMNAISTSGDDLAVFEACDFLGNEAGKHGGAVHLLGNYFLDGGLWFKDCMIQNNKAGEKGGALYCAEDNEMTLENTDVQHNTAQKQGGGVFVEDDSDAYVILRGMTKVMNNIGLDGRVDNIYLSADSYLIVKNITGEANSIGIRHNGSDSTLGRIENEDGFNVLFSDNLEFVLTHASQLPSLLKIEKASVLARAASMLGHGSIAAISVLAILLVAGATIGVVVSRKKKEQPMNGNT